MKPLTLDDKAKLESILRNSGDFLSEYCFSNLYLFRRKHRYAVEESGGCLFIRGVSYDGLSYVMPCCQKQLASPEYREALTAQLSQVDMIFPVSAKALAYFGEESFRFESMAEDLDYIYAREKMQFFPGRRLQNKRNLLYQFLKYYPDHRTVDLSEAEARDGAVAVLERWQSSFDSEESTDYEPCREALELYDELGLSGFLPSTCSHSLPPSDSEQSAPMATPSAVTTAAARLPESFSYVNMEQDLGSLPLRASKSSYLPDMMAQKYRIFKR